MTENSEQFLRCESLHAGYDGSTVLHGIDLRIEPGEMVGIIGPNGSGKSTLLKTMNGALSPTSGQVLIEGRDVSRMRSKERARLIGVVQQNATVIFAFRVWDVVAMGRHAYLGPLEGLGPEDRSIIQWALERTDCARLAERSVTELSGGELQRVIIARALAQRPKVLLLDEPTNHLDINHQFQIGQLLQSLNRERGLTVIWVSHDVNLASEFCRRIVMLREGIVVADGSPDEVVTEENLSGLYGMQVPVHVNPASGRPQVVMAAQPEAPA